MPVPDYQSLMLHVLSVAAGGEVRIGDAVERLANQLGLTAEERAELLPSGKQTLFANRVHWAKTYLGKAGLVELTRRGYFRITDRGRQVMGSHPRRIDNAFLNQFAEFRKFTAGTAAAVPGRAPCRSGSAQARLSGDSAIAPRCARRLHT